MKGRFWLQALQAAAAGIAVALLLAPDSRAHAQGSAPYYWRYDAPGRLNLLRLGDLDRDDIGELVIAAGEVNLTLLGADGRPLWSQPIQFSSSIVALELLDVDGSGDSQLEIAVASQDELALVSLSGAVRWRQPLDQPPAALAAYRPEPEGAAQPVVAVANGTVARYDAGGERIWQFSPAEPPPEQASLRLAASDLDRDGRDELIYSHPTANGFSRLQVFGNQGQLLWAQQDPGRVSGLKVVEFDAEGPREIAVATSLNRVYLYTHDGLRRWPYRSPNRPVTALAFAQLERGPALIVGTSVGSLIAYDPLGRRYWSSAYTAAPDRPILSVSPAGAAGGAEEPMALALVLGPAAEAGETADVLLLDDNGIRLEPAFPLADLAGLTQLADLNRDGNSELVLANFASLELLDPGIGVRQFSQNWEYRLAAGPQAVLIADIDLDGEPEGLFGADDGKLHALEGDGSKAWEADLGGVVSQLALAAAGEDNLPEIVAVHNDIATGDAGVENIEGWIEVLRPDARPVWDASLPTSISSILVGDINRSQPPELIVGTADGQLLAYSLDGDLFWQAAVNGSVTHLYLVDESRGTEVVVGTGSNTVDRFNNKGTGFFRLAEFLDNLLSLDVVARTEAVAPMLVAAVEDGAIRAFDSRGAELWEARLDAEPTSMLVNNATILVGTDEQELIRLDLDGNILWQRAGLGRITSLHWGDLDGDVRPDIAVGNRDGEVHLLTAEGDSVWHVLNLGSPVFYATAFPGSSQQAPELLTVTESGFVQLFRSQANRPPLLVNPTTEVSQGRYNITVNVIDVERDEVTVSLELFDPAAEGWSSAGDKVGANGNDLLFWAVNPPAGSGPVAYRFRYDDGAHQGQVMPAAGPVAIAGGQLFEALPVLGTLLVLGLVLVSWAVLRQNRVPNAPVRNLLRRLKLRPELALVYLEESYADHSGSPDFLLSLANQARKEERSALANMADGLFLLQARPDSAVPILVGAVQQGSQRNPAWLAAGAWLANFETAQALLTAPSLTELSLLRPGVEQLLQDETAAESSRVAFAPLLPVMQSLRDSERVDLADDRLVYLNEAASLLRQTVEAAAEPRSLAETLLKAISQRWQGLVKAEIEELHGRAQLEARLLTRNLAPGPDAVVALELKNVGRAPAEKIEVALADDSAYGSPGPMHTIAYLPPGRARQLQFTIEPGREERFRVVFNIAYDDRSASGRRLAYADMVHQLAPVRTYAPINNPYSPGMPLRRNSTTFVGREELFHFIGHTTGEALDRRVLILVGQRRTGKTSALLQLDQHLPAGLIPVYIDCQSLGVVPGMPAFFHDLAWIIADALAAHDLSLEVPGLDDWINDPAGRFQRDFLPAARRLMPAQSALLLIFDEFEAFENLVNDGILPRTLFTFLRHLMQHGRGLSFIFAGTRRLEEMSSDYWSVLFNIALYRQIGFLDEVSARRLIQGPVAPHILYDDLAIDKILRVTAGHPYFIQLVCYTLINRANATQNGYITISDVNATLEEMLRLGEVHFAYLWQQSSYSEKSLLAAAARLAERDVPFRPAELVQYLAQFSIYLEPAEVTYALNRLVEREILREKAEEGATHYELRIGLVGLWVAQNKSLIRLYEARGTGEAPGWTRASVSG
ncbi:MAG: PQQ-binding-like beta-propeller repeat protein [Candidatus Promineifilaceae bacterium]